MVWFGLEIGDKSVIEVCDIVFCNARLAIARAVYQKSSILILDEATSALDSRSEQLVRQAVQRLMEDRTVRTLN